MIARATAVSLAALLVAVSGCNDKSKGASSTAPSATAAAAAPDLKEGGPAPDVELALQDGRKVKLSSLEGKLVALYFYPKDETRGCTIEAQDFRDRFGELAAAGIVVVGVSAQDADSHKAFIDKEKLPFDLAIDADGSLAKAFGVPVGVLGLHARQTFLIGKDGRIKKIWRDVTPKDHGAEVLAAAKT